MADASPLKDALPTPARKIWQLLRDNLSDPFRAFYYGDPVLIPESMLPCIVVDTINSASDLGPTQFDDLTTSVIVKVIFNKKDDFNATPEQALTKQKVEFYTEGRDINTGLYLPNTIMGILRTNITLEENASQFTAGVNYDVIIRPEDTITEESHTTLNVSAIIQVPNRV